MTLWLPLYAGFGRLATPALHLYGRRRIARGKEDPARFGERFGHDERPRPPGRLIWVHAASVGESLSILPVIETWLDTFPTDHVLVTTVTRTAADLLAHRLPARALHAYAPYDTAPAWRRFQAHWRPDATVVVEQELWPMMLCSAPRPRLLVNARLSARSAGHWRRMGGIARWLLGRFEVILAMTAGDAARLRELGASPVETPGNLKEAAPPLPVDPAVLDAWRTALDGRPVFVAASTHEPEEGWIEAADRRVCARHGDLLTIVVPRHPERGASILAAFDRGDARLRSVDPRPPDRSIRLLVADTMGELGLFYRLADVAFVGGSLIPHGGQNPLEPARLGRPVLFGPHMANFADAADRLLEAGAAKRTTRDTLAADVATWLDDVAARTRAGDAARAVTADAGAAVARTVDALRRALEG
ncbi:MAG: 3-deoxy-D-manno-octulosonic acid transferase [Pseudomonadota bacterium]